MKRSSGRGARPMLDGDVIEVRQVQELSEFPPDEQAAAGVK